MQDDFKPVLLELLASHPGLEFLQSTPEFQERYGMITSFEQISLLILLELEYLFLLSRIHASHMSNRPQTHLMIGVLYFLFCMFNI